MTGRRHAPPDHQQQYNRNQVSARGLACPFAMSDPDAYMNITACRASEGFKALRELNEHIWRKHTPFYRCGFCHVRWSISTARGKVTQMKEQHWETCEGRRRGTPYFERYDEDGTELLDRDQQRRFAETKSIRRNDEKLKALYEACDKPPPESYYVPDAIPHDSGFLAGFAQLRSEGHHRQPRRRTTANNVSRADAQAAQGDFEVSGANRQPDADSGYVSMPRNDCDASNISSFDGFPSQHSALTYHWGGYAPSQTRSYEVVGTHVAATTTGAGNPASDENFVSIGDPLYRGCLDYGAVDPLLYHGATSSNRSNNDGSQALLGLTLPGPVEPVNMWAFTNIDADLSEY